MKIDGRFRRHRYRLRQASRISRLWPSRDFTGHLRQLDN